MLSRKRILLILVVVSLLAVLLWLLLCKTVPSSQAETPTETQTSTTAPTEIATVPTHAPTIVPTQPTEESKPASTEATQETTPATQPATAEPTSPPTQPTTPPAPTQKPTQKPTQAPTQAPTQPATPTLKINTKSFTIIYVGDTLQIDYTYSGDKSKLTWSSDDTSKLTVNSKGVVTGKAAGTAGVIISDGNITRVVLITVSDAPKATKLEKMSFNAPLYDGVIKYAGDYMTFEVYAMPEESNRQCVVTSSNSSVVSVSYDYDYSNITQVTLNFKRAGNAKVTIISADGNVSESYNITVKADYACNPGSGILTPEQFVNAYNGVVNANGMDTSYVATRYLVLTLSESDLTWSTARRNAEGGFHSWWLVGYRKMVLTYEGINENGKHVFYEHGCS